MKLTVSAMPQIPRFFIKLQCRYCWWRLAKWCLMWGGPMPPVWFQHIFFYHLCGMFSYSGAPIGMWAFRVPKHEKGTENRLRQAAH